MMAAVATAWVEPDAARVEVEMVAEVTVVAAMVAAEVVAVVIVVVHLVAAAAVVEAQAGCRRAYCPSLRCRP